jgi:endonuclease G, mitochondrial
VRSKKAAARSYAEGEIERRLKAVRGKPVQRPGPDFQPWRSAAAVIVAFDPAELQPVGAAAAAAQEAGGLGLLPELVAATGRGRTHQQLWTLPTAARKAELRRLGTQREIAAALGANPNRLPVPLQQMFDRVVVGSPLPPLEELCSDDLGALLVVVDWLEGIPISPRPPALTEVRARLESLRDVDRLRLLAGDVFIGREAELARLHAHLHGTERSILFISGTGGAGKSALLAKSLLTLADETRDPACWVRVDIADGNVTARDPITLLSQAAQQLSRRDSTLERVVSSFVHGTQARSISRDLSSLESMSSPEDEVYWAVHRFEDVVKRYRAGVGQGDVFAFCIDSFEEAQLLGEPVATPLLEMLAQLAAATTCRVVVCGRAAPPDEYPFTPQESALDGGSSARLEILPLADLVTADAERLLELFIRKEKPEVHVVGEMLRRVVETVGGNPLTLKLAAQLINIKGPEAVSDPLALKELKSETAQARLYTRILGHIDNQDVQRLAIPGLVVRIIDKDVIRIVLAGPCGLGDVDKPRAEGLLTALEREISLVERLADGALRYRAENRRVMLAGMPDEIRDQVDDIHRQAVAHWGGLSGVRARGEELYHMLRLGADLEELDRRWSDEMATELQAALQGVVEELTPGSPPRAWLAEKLGITLSERERATIAVEVQESQAERAATQFLAHGEAGRALAVLEKQRPFRPGSRLYGLLSRVLFRLGRIDDALSATDDGIERMRRSGDDAALTDLLLLRAYIFESAGKVSDALELLTHADTEATPRLARLRLNVRQARLLRKLDRDDPALRTELIRRTDGQEMELVQHSALLREAAAEIGDANPTLLGRALDVFGPELFGRMPPDELQKILLEIGAISKEDLATFAGISPIKLVELVHTNLDQLIHGTGERSRKASRLFTALLRRSVDEVLQQTYSTEPEQRRASASPGAAADAGTASTPEPRLTRESRRKIVDVLVRDVPAAILHKISQFNLDLDLERLGGSLPMHELTERLVDTAESRDLLEPLLQGVLANVSAEAAAELREIIAEARVFDRLANLTHAEKSASMSYAEAGALMDLLAASSKRTDWALGESAAAIRSFESTTRRGLGPDPEVEAAPASKSSAQRLRSNPRDAVERRLQRMGYAADQVKDVAEDTRWSVSPFESSSELADEPLGLERIIGRNMLIEASYLEAGLVASRSVGRLIIRDTRGRLLGFATGFLVGPRLLLTNNHVLTSFDVAGASQVEFNYQRALDGHVGPTILFDLDPTSFFASSPIKDLDFSLVAVKPTSSDGQSLEEFGYNPLTAVTDEILSGECVTIIQHPRGEPKQIALRKNEVLKLPDDEDRFLHYQTDTNPVSSGSPVFNDGWEVVALHHSGKPATDENGTFLADDGTLWEPEMGLDRVKWLANEGIRVAALVKFLGTQTLTDAQKALLAPALDPAPRPAKPVGAALRTAPPRGDESSDLKLPHAGTATKTTTGPNVLLSQPATSSSNARGANDSTASATTGSPSLFVTTPDGGVTLPVPLQITIRLGGAVAAAAPDEAIEELIRIDPDYSNREGYDPEFLGDGELAVPLPELTAAMAANAAANRMARPGAPSYELPYHHFSVVVNRKRRLAYFTAVNIDGRRPTRGKRGADRWSFDPRIDDSLQVGNDFYKGTVFDRGHLVRRLDPAWGTTEAVAKSADDDTFHFTTCSPQHKRFNEGKNLWAGLEDYLLNRAGDERRKMIVFTGPVFAKTDQLYRGLPIPTRFWKVVAMPSKRGRLVATAFVVSQEDLIRPLFEAAAEVATTEEVAQLFQVRVRKVESLTGLDFGTLRDHDPTGALQMFEVTEEGGRELEEYPDIELGI